MLQEVENALRLHRQWKARLIADADRGLTNFDVDTVRRADQCDVGRWIIRCSATLGADPKYARIRNVHADFHIAAANVVRKIKARDCDGARRDMESGPYADATLCLVRELTRWAEELRQTTAA